ncbi:MAG: NAD-dependent epimerase/dehydratase family protein [Planctomyces sp.]|nr:NAD-dependent epimerase/dehydratase family protein [Planctomyces sp.]
MRVLVTGGAGFIGSCLVDQLLASGHEVAVLDDLSSGSRENLPADVPFYEADVRDADAVRGVFEKVRPDAVSHQAAQMSVSRSVREPRFDAEVNVLGLIHALDAAVAQNVERFVFASSGGVIYGEVSGPVQEDAPGNPISPYGIAKWVGERYLQFYSREHNLRCTALRYANVYGPRQNPHGEAGVVAIFCTKMFQGEAATINGDGRYIRDYVEVSDVARANVLALEASELPPFAAFNVGTSVPTDVNQLAEALRDACQAELARRGSRTTVPACGYGPPRAGDLRTNLVSYDSIRRVLGWAPTVSLANGLPKTAEWFATKLLRSS